MNHPRLFGVRWQGVTSSLLAVIMLTACHAAPRETATTATLAPSAAPSAPLSDAPFARASQWVTIGDRRLHLRCIGSGSPTILLEAGIGGDSSGWVFVQPRLAQATRVCSYDRAGYYFSDPGPLPRTADVVVDDLHRLLEAASIRAPILLVGHSLGGLLARLYAATYPADVLGMVLLDPVLDDIEDIRPPKESDQAEEDPFVVKCLAAAKNGTITTDAALKEECIGAPDARLSAELNAAQARAAARTTTWETLLSEGKEMRSGRTGARVRAAHEVLEQLPLLVMTKGRVRVPPGHEAKVAEEYYGRTVIRHAELAARSQRSLHVVSKSGHQMPMDAAELVVAGVHAVLKAYGEHTAVMP
jgi:pimeloyl-ACP methyl ester carboxylesterase